MSRNLPFPEGTPSKPEYIASNVIACGEWDRICAALAAQGLLSPAWREVIALASHGYAWLLALGEEMETRGRTKELALCCAETLDFYREACAQCEVEMNPLVRLRALAGAIR